MKEYLQLIQLIAANAEEFRPVVAKTKDVLKSYGPELSDLFDTLSDYFVDRRASAVKRLMEVHGFTKDEAISLTVDVLIDIRRAMAKNKDSSK